MATEQRILAMGGVSLRPSSTDWPMDCATNRKGPQPIGALAKASGVGSDSTYALGTRNR